jgi:hypothetical protein
LGRLQTEIQALSHALTTGFAEDPKEAQKKIAKYTQDIKKADTDISQIDCKDTGKYKESVDSFYRAIGAFQTYWRLAGGRRLGGADTTNCEASKTTFNGSEHKDELNAFLEEYNNAYTQYQKDYDSDVPAAKSLIDELKKRIGVGAIPVLPA